MEINFSNSNEDISFVELHRFLSFLVSSKKMKLDKETETHITEMTKKYIGLEEFINMTEEEIVQKRLAIEKQFQSQFDETSGKFTKLTLIKEILEIDLNYYYKQLKNIKNILKNDNFKVSINIINDKISTNQELTDSEKQQITFYSKLVNQKVYIENIILSDKKIFKSTVKDQIKQELFKEMKELEKETKIIIEEKKESNDFDYKKLLKTYNDFELQKLLSTLNDMIFEDKNESLRYKIIDNLHRLTQKSYKEINLILKDNKFKEKLFGNLKIETVNEKLTVLSEKMNHYKQIDTYLRESKKLTYVCPVCNYSHDMPITVMLHMSLHKIKEVNPIPFAFFNHNGEQFSHYSVKSIKTLGDYTYEMKKNMNNANKKMVNEIIKEDINKSSFEDMRQPLSLNKIIFKIDNEKNINGFEKSITEKFNDFSIFGEDKKIKKIIEQEINKMKKTTDKKFTKNTRIISFKIFKIIFEKFIEDEDITNMYNSVIEYYDENLKSDNNQSFDLLFKNIIHYNNRKPIEVVYQLFKKLFKIIKGIKQQKYAEVLYILGKKKLMEKEAYESVDTKALMLLIPFLKSLDLLNNIHDNIGDDEDIKVNDDFHPSSWTSSDNYQKLVNKMSNITKDNLIINTSNERQTEDIREQFTRLNEMFQNVDMKKIKKMEKQFDLIYNSVIYMVKNNMFLHDISSIESNKNIQEKYNEYMNGLFLMITMRYMNMFVKQNKNNTENTKMIFDSFFKTLSLYLTEESKYLKKNQVIRRRVVRRQQPVVTDNRDELLNEYFESDDEDFNEEIGEEEELVEEGEDELMEDLFGDDEEDYE